MLVKGSMVTEMSGSLGGITAARNKGGQYLRARATPVDPNTQPQQTARAAMTQLVTAWIEDLTEQQREAWRIYAENVTTTNRLGDTISLSGQNWYIGCNTPRIRAGLARVDDAPTVYDQASLAPVSIAVTGQDLDVTFDDTASWVNQAGSALLVQTSPQQNPTKLFYKGPFTFTTAILGDDTTPPVSPVGYEMDQNVAAGNLLYARIRLSLADGRLSTPQIVSAVGS